VKRCVKLKSKNCGKLNNFARGWKIVARELSPLLLRLCSHVLYKLLSNHGLVRVYKIKSILFDWSTEMQISFKVKVSKFSYKFESG